MRRYRSPESRQRTRQAQLERQKAQRAEVTTHDWITVSEEGGFIHIRTRECRRCGLREQFNALHAPDQHYHYTPKGTYSWMSTCPPCANEGGES